MRLIKGDVLVPKARQFPEGAVVVDGYDELGRLMARPLNGGFQQYFPAANASGFRVADEAERSRVLFRRSHFVLADSEETFSGLTDRQAWNRWGLPRFDKVEAERLIRRLWDEGARFDAERDALVTVRARGAVSV